MSTYPLGISAYPGSIPTRTDVDIAIDTGRSLSTLRSDRFKCQGLPYVKIGRSVRYDLDDVIRFMEDRKIIHENEH